MDNSISVLLADDCEEFVKSVKDYLDSQDGITVAGSRMMAERHLNL